LIDLRRKKGMLVSNDVNESAPPAPPQPTSSEPPLEQQLGYVAPPNPAPSPYHRDDLPSASDERVDWLTSLHANGDRAAASAPAEAEDNEQANMPSWLIEELARDASPLDRAAATVESDANLPPWLRDSTDLLDPARADELEMIQNPASNGQSSYIPPWQPPSAATPPSPSAFSTWLGSHNTPSAEVESSAPPPGPPVSSPAEGAEEQPQIVTPDEAAAEASDAPPAPFQPEVSDGEAEAETALPQEVELADESSAATNKAIAEATAPAAANATPTSTALHPTSGEPGSGAELPPWLRVVGSDGATVSGDSVMAAMPDAPADSFFPTAAAGGVQNRVIPNWLRGRGVASQDAIPSSAEALTAAMAEPVQRIQRVMSVRPAPRGAAEALATLAATPSASTRTSPLALKDERNVPASLARWLFSERAIYLLTALVMVAVVLADRVWSIQPLGAVVPPAANAQVDSFYKAINTLPPDAAVLVAYDWDANRQAEMEPLARAVTCHLGAVNARFATVSLVATGPAFAQRVAEATVDRASPCTARRYNYGSDYVNLGYSAGGDFTLRSMVGSIATVFSKDYRDGNDLFGGNGVAALKNVNRLADFKLIIVLEGDESTARSWVEQVASQPNTPPLLLGEPAALDPSLQPYLALAAPTRFLGKVAGLSDTSYYQYKLTGKQINTDLPFSLNALSFAALLIALLIIIGNVMFIARLINSRK